jgi:hypothetical protein
VRYEGIAGEMSSNTQKPYPIVYLRDGSHIRVTEDNVFVFEPIKPNPWIETI